MSEELDIDNIPTDAELYVRHHQCGVLHVVTKGQQRTWCNQFHTSALQAATSQDVLLELCGACKRSLTGILAKLDAGGEHESKPAMATAAQTG